MLCCLLGILRFVCKCLDRFLDVVFFSWLLKSRRQGSNNGESRKVDAKLAGHGLGDLYDAGPYSINCNASLKS